MNITNFAWMNFPYLKPVYHSSDYHGIIFCIKLSRIGGTGQSSTRAVFASTSVAAIRQQYSRTNASVTRFGKIGRHFGKSLQVFGKF